ncbi:hypothetical protein EDD11_001612 [Mortierella claussenii]|nr:hypothetical protein EDD11_001612 [Mortierella claussenii]
MAAQPVCREIEFTPNEDLQYREFSPGVTLQLVDAPVTPGAASHSSLFAVSNKFGYFVAGSSHCFVFDKLSTLRKAFLEGSEEENAFESRTKIDIPNNALRMIRLSADEQTVVASLVGGKILLYKASDLMAKVTGVQPYGSLELDDEILDIRPNPSPEKNGLAAVLLVNQSIKLINMDGAPSVTLNKCKYTAMAWSAKGKQIMCGTATGTLQQIDPEGVIKKEHQANPDNDGQWVMFINWIETSVFIVVYCSPPQDDQTPTEYNVCVISKEVPAQPTYLSFGDICFAMPEEEAGSTYFMTPSIKSWGTEIKDLITVASSPSMDVGVIGRAGDGSWRKWDLDDTKRATVPGADCVCVGTGLDLTSTEILDPVEEDAPKVQPSPIFYIYNNLGRLAAYHIINLETAKTGATCPAMVKPTSLSEAGVKSKSAAGPAKTVSVAAATVPPGSASKLSTSSPITAAAPSPMLPTAPRAPQQKAPVATKVTLSSSSSFFNSPNTSLASHPTVITAPPIQQSKPPPSLINPTTPILQQSKPLVPKQKSGAMQKLLQEEEPIKINRRKSTMEESSAPTPKVSAAMDALSRQLENTYLAMTEELRTLQSHVRETEELVKAREYVFGELDQFMKVTTKRIKVASDARALAESVYSDFVQLRADLIKVTTKKDEIGRLLRARQDPNLHAMLQSSELNPAQLSQQARMKASFENVDNRLVELEDHVETLSLKAARLRHGQDAEGPTLDSIRRAMWNISHALLQRQDDLDQLSQALDNFAISESLNPAMDRAQKAPVKEASVALNPRKTFRPSESLSPATEQRLTTHAKDEIARQLRRVFTHDRRTKSMLTTLSQSTPGGPLSVVPRTPAPEFVPAAEPRRAETKKRHLAIISTPTEASLATPNPIAHVTPSASTTSNASAPPASAAFGTALPSPAPFGSVQPSLGLFASAQSSPSVSGSALSPSPFAASTQSTFGGPSFGSSARSQMFSGFQVSQPNTSSPLVAPTTPGSAWGTLTSDSEQPKAFAGFQVPTSKAVELSSIPTFNFAPPLQQDEDQEEAEEADEQEVLNSGDDGEDVDEEEEEDNEVRDYRTRYVHDGQEFDIEDDGSEPETWGSDTDQRDFEQEGGDDDDVEQVEDEDDEDHEEAEDMYQSQTLLQGEGKAEPAKNAWASPGFQFPAVAPSASGTPATSGSLNAGFSFFTAKQSKEPSEIAKTQSPFGTSSGSNTFGSQTTFAFGKPSESTSAAPDVTTPKDAASETMKTQTIDKAPVVIATPAPRKQELTDSEESEEEAVVDDGANSEDEQDERLYRGEEESDEEQEQYSDNEGDVSDEGSVAEDEKQLDSDESGQLADDQEDDSDKESALTAVQLAQEKLSSDAFESKARVSTNSTGSFNLVEKTNALDESDLDFNKAGLGGSKFGKSSETAIGSTGAFGSAPAFGSGPTFGSAASSKTSGKGLDMPFVKLPRAPKGTRDSLDSNTEDDEDGDALLSDSDGSPLMKNREVKLPASTSFVQPSSDSKSSLGGLNSFSLSLGGNQTSQPEAKPASAAWGTSSTSSWESVNQSSTPVSGWGQGATMSAALPAISSAATALSPFAQQSSSAVTPAPTAWGSGGAGFGSGTSATSGFGQTSALGSSGTAFGQPSTLGSGFGQMSTVGPAPSASSTFGQTSQRGGSDFGQTSTLGSGSGFGHSSQLDTGSAFGQPSTLGSGSTFGQTSTFGSGSTFGATSQLGTGSGFGQTSQMGPGVGFGQTAFGQPSQIGGGPGGGFTKAPATSFTTQSNFGSFANTNAFAALASSGTNVLDQQASQGGGFGDTNSGSSVFGGGSSSNNTGVFGTGGGFGSSGPSVFGSGGGFGGSGGGGGSSSQGGSGFSAFGSGGNASAFGSGGGATAFGSSSGFGSGQTGFGGAGSGGQQGFGSQQAQDQASSVFGSNQGINPNKSSFQGFR